MHDCCSSEVYEKWDFFTAPDLRAQVTKVGSNAGSKTHTVPGKTKPFMTYKWNFSSQTGFKFPKMVLVRFLVLPTCTVT